MPSKRRVVKKITKKPSPRTRPRTFYTLREDAMILKALDSRKKDQTLSSVAGTLARKLDRSVESVRDRIKKYLGGLSKADRKNIMK